MSNIKSNPPATIETPEPSAATYQYTITEGDVYFDGADYFIVDPADGVIHLVIDINNPTIFLY